METLISPSPLLTAFLIAVIAAAFLFICWRTQSVHFVLRRFWLLVHGQKDIPDPAIQAFAQEQTSLYAFRLFSGTQVKTLEQAHQLIAWCQAQQVPISTVSACVDCFDLEKRTVIAERLPGSTWRVAMFFWSVMLLITCIGSFFMAIHAPGLASLKATDRPVILSENSVRLAWAMPFTTNALDRGDCKNQNPKRLEGTRFSEQEIQSICSLFDASDWNPYIEKLMHEQRNQLFINALVFFIIFLIHARDINKFSQARALHQKLKLTEEI